MKLGNCSWHRRDGRGREVRATRDYLRRAFDLLGGASGLRERQGQLSLNGALSSILPGDARRDLRISPP